MKIIYIISLVLLSSHQAAAFAPSRSAIPTFARSNLDTKRYNFFANIGSMIKNFGREVTASHILIGPKTMGEVEAKAKLEELKAEIGDDPVKFAEAAREFSTCPSSKKGGDLGTFGPGLMVKQFDTVCWEEDVGVVHGPVSTNFGEHLILITDRTGDDK